MNLYFFQWYFLWTMPWFCVIWSKLLSYLKSLLFSSVKMGITPTQTEWLCEEQDSVRNIVPSILPNIVGAQSVMVVTNIWRSLYLAADRSRGFPARINDTDCFRFILSALSHSWLLLANIFFWPTNYCLLWVELNCVPLQIHMLRC